MATVGAALNAEPALPEDRKKQQLPPKSYANAVEEDAPAGVANGVNGKKGLNGTTTNGSSDVGSSDDVKKGHQPSVLRIVGTGAPAVEERKEDAKEDRPQFERQESKHEYSATVFAVRFSLMDDG